MELTRVALDKLKLDGRNARKHSKRNLATIAGSLGAFGQVENLVVQAGTMKVIGGNGRVEAMRAAGDTHAHVLLLDVDDKKAAKLGLALNRTAELAGWEKGNLADIIGELQADGIDVADIGFEASELADIIGADDIDVQDGDDDEVTPSDGPEVSKVGDIWQLGEHRVMCGDSTCANHVNALMQGRDAFIMVTDPPYGIAYNPKWREGHGLGKEWRTDKIENDTKHDWTESYDLFKGDVAYVWHAPQFMTQVASHLMASGFVIRSHITWIKPHIVMSRGDYHPKTEPLIYAVKKGRKGHWCGGRKQNNAWEIAVANGFMKDVDSDGGDTSHPTQKPIECMARPMRNHGNAGDLAYDPFLGSGTSIIAAERTERVCYGLELTPKYTDVIVERWQNATGGKAVKVTHA